MEGKKTLESALFIAEPEFAHRFFLIPDRIVVNNSQFDEQILYDDEQAPDYIPRSEQNIDEADGRYKLDILQKTNQQLFDAFGLCFAGAIIPEDAINIERVLSGKISSKELKTNMNFPDCDFINEPQGPPNFYDGWESSQRVGGVTGYFDHVTGQKVDLPILGVPQRQFLSNIYPNPGSNLMHIKGEKNEILNLKILNMLGQTKMTVDKLESNITLDISKLNSALYFVILKALNSDRTKIFKFVKS